jgi:diguanylate cyclase (GGDEF)-like protein
VLLDIDYFKQINDTYGHQAGDAVLVNFAHICRENIREIDLLARIGGDEFAILLPLASSSQASEVMGRVHAALAASQNARPATISVGIACMPCAVNTLDGLLGQADQALYRAKHAGRNRSEIY